jgi:hypothetical protein
VGLTLSEFDQRQLPALITKHLGERSHKRYSALAKQEKALGRLFLQAGIVQQQWR